MTLISKSIEFDEMTDIWRTIWIAIRMHSRRNKRGQWEIKVDKERKVIAETARRILSNKRIRGKSGNNLLTALSIVPEPRATFLALHKLMMGH